MVKPLEVFGFVLVLKFGPLEDDPPVEVDPPETVPLEPDEPELPVEPITLPPADGGRTTAAFEPLIVPPEGCIPGTRFGVR